MIKEICMSRRWADWVATRYPITVLELACVLTAGSPQSAYIRVGRMARLAMAEETIIEVLDEAYDHYPDVLEHTLAHAMAKIGIPGDIITGLVIL